jgi:hypothetical protein
VPGRGQLLIFVRSLELGVRIVGHSRRRWLLAASGRARGSSARYLHGDDAVAAWGRMASILSEAERREAAAMLQRLLSLVATNDLAVGGPRGLSLQRRLEGALLALDAVAQVDRNRRD